MKQYFLFWSEFVVGKLSPTLCDPMDCSLYLPEFAQIHVHWVGDAIQPSHPLLAPSSPAFNPFQHKGLFQWVGSSSYVAKYWSFSINPSNEYSVLISFRFDWFDLAILISVSEIFMLLIWFWNSGTFIGRLTLCIVSCPWEKCTMGIAQFPERVLKTVTNAFVLYVIFCVECCLEFSSLCRNGIFESCSTVK